MNRDFVEILSALSGARAEFLIVGAHALAAYGIPRATGDLDIWVNATSDNAPRVMAALLAFGAPLLDLTLADLTAPDTVFQIGQVPSRVDILTGVSGVSFGDAWPRRVLLRIEGIDVPVLSRARRTFSISNCSATDYGLVNPQSITQRTNRDGRQAADAMTRLWTLN